jgi:transketolase
VNTLRKDSVAVTPESVAGNYIYYGVREFAMTAMMNGVALHGGFIPYAGTFLVFSDYARNAVRLAALMHLRVVLVYTHDSIGLGEDGPTHQPVEHLAGLRAMPNISVWRPGDAAETAVAWLAALEHARGPSCLVLTRQALPQQSRTPAQIAAIARGGYTLVDCQGVPEALLIGTGSELSLAVDAARELSAQGRRVRVISMPNCELFLAQDQTYRDAVLPPAVRRRVAVEAAASLSWHRFVGADGLIIALDRFGASGKAPDLFRHFGITTAAVRDAVLKLLA